MFENNTYKVVRLSSFLDLNPLHWGLEICGSELLQFQPQIIAQGKGAETSSVAIIVKL